MANARDLDDIDLQILALFDDDSALARLEDILLNSEMYNFNLYNGLETQPSVLLMENYQIVRNNQYQYNNTFCNMVYQNNRRNTTPRQSKDKDGFAIPHVYDCMYCEKRFYSQTALRKHQLNHAKDQLRCPRCRKRSYSFGILRRHYIYFHYIHRQKYIGRLPMKE